MKKIILIIVIFVSTFAPVYPQNPDELQSINNNSKVQFVKPEMLDQLMIALRKYETEPVRRQDTLLLDTYRNISSAYMANNHFKQAYEVYIKYINIKEDMLSADKTVSINEAINSVSSLQQKDEKNEIELQTKLNQLKEENELLAMKQLSFKRNFSLALIILTSIFAIMLVSSGIRMISLRSKLQQNRDRMKNIHRLAVTGNFSSGLRTSMKTVLKTSEGQTSELHQIFKKQEQSFSPVKQANQIISGIEKTFKEISDIL